jgi:type I restriction enzyme M protein
MLTGELRSQVDKVWDAFWTGGISNPLEVIEQITYLLFLRRLDDLQTLQELNAQRLKKPIERRIFPAGKDSKKLPYEQMRWSNFKNLEPRKMYDIVSEHVFPFLRTLGADESTYAHHMKDARFTVPTPSLLGKVVDLLDHVPMEDRDTKGDVYEYMLGKIASAGQNGQFRTPRHIIRLMVEMVEPKPKDMVCDPACGTCGFLVAVGEYLRERHPETLTDPKLRQHFHRGLFHGFDFDNTMLRIGSMNMLLHGVENPDVIYRDSLSQDHAGEEEKYTLVLANPPFAGSLDYENTAKDLLQVVKTKKTELLFLALFLRLLNRRRLRMPCEFQICRTARRVLAKRAGSGQWRSQALQGSQLPWAPRFLGLGRRCRLPMVIVRGQSPMPSSRSVPGVRKRHAASCLFPKPGPPPPPNAHSVRSA